MKHMLIWQERRWVGLGVGLALCLSAAIARADVEDKISRSFTVSAGGTLALEADRGAVEVKGTDATTVEVEVRRKASSQEILDDHEVTLDQDGNRVEVRARYAKNLGFSWFGGRNLQVKYIISVPHEYNVELKTAGGAISVARIMGEVRSETSGGSLAFEEIDGPLMGRTSGGSVAASKCHGKVDVKTSGGSISLAEIEGNVNATTSGGSVTAHKVGGKCTVSTSGGGIRVQEIRGALQASTSGGSVAAEFAEAPAADCSLKTSGGGITVVLPAQTAMDVDLRASGGHVVSELPVEGATEGERKRTQLQGKINGGGPTLLARTSGGSIRVKSQ